MISQELQQQIDSYRTNAPIGPMGLSSAGGRNANHLVPPQEVINAWSAGQPVPEQFLPFLYAASQYEQQGQWEPGSNRQMSSSDAQGIQAQWSQDAKPDFMTQAAPYLILGAGGLAAAGAFGAGGAAGAGGAGGAGGAAGGGMSGLTGDILSGGAGAGQGLGAATLGSSAYTAGTIGGMNGIQTSQAVSNLMESGMTQEAAVAQVASSTGTTAEAVTASMANAGAEAGVSSSVWQQALQNLGNKGFTSQLGQMLGGMMGSASDAGMSPAGFQLPNMGGIAQNAQNTMQKYGDVANQYYGMNPSYANAAFQRMYNDPYAQGAQNSANMAGYASGRMAPYALDASQGLYAAGLNAQQQGQMAAKAGMDQYQQAQQAIPVGQTIFNQGQQLFDQGQQQYRQAQGAIPIGLDMWRKSQGAIPAGQEAMAAGKQVWETAQDPRQELYNRTLGQVTDQSRAAQAARGLSMSPIGGQMEGDTNRNFNIDWQNQQLQRQATGSQALNAGTGVYYGGLGAAEAGANAAFKGYDTARQGYNSALGGFGAANQGANTLYGGLAEAQRGAQALNAGIGTGYAGTGVYGAASQQGYGLGQGGINQYLQSGQLPYAESQQQGQNQFTALGANQRAMAGNLAPYQQQIQDYMNYLNAGMNAQSQAAYIQQMNNRQGQQNIQTGAGGGQLMGNIIGGLASNVDWGSVGNWLGGLSEPSAKENIELITVLPNSLGVYAFDYKPEFKEEFGHGRKIGVMADEVQRIMPEAIIMHQKGYRMVNYSMIGI